MCIGKLCTLMYCFGIDNNIAVSKPNRGLLELYNLFKIRDNKIIM